MPLGAAYALMPPDRRLTHLCPILVKCVWPGCGGAYAIANAIGSPWALGAVMAAWGHRTSR